MMKSRVGPRAGILPLEIVSYINLTSNEVDRMQPWIELAHQASSLFEATCAFHPKMLDLELVALYYEAAARSSAPLSFIARRRGFHFSESFRLVASSIWNIDDSIMEQVARCTESYAALEKAGKISKAHKHQFMCMMASFRRNASITARI